MESKTTLQVGVKILLRDEMDKYLLLRRSPERYPDVKGRWDIVGGRIDAGSTLIDNLRREIQEETALELKGVPTLIAAQDIIPSKERHIVRLTYIGQAEGEIHLDGEEHDAYHWYTLAELKAVEDLDIYLKQLLDDGTIESL